MHICMNHVYNVYIIHCIMYEYMMYTLYNDSIDDVHVCTYMLHL